MNKNLTQQIEKQLFKLKKLIEQIGNHDINPEDSELWDPDYYYDLTEQLKDALKLLEDQKTSSKYGETLTLEPGICSLIDDYQENQEENNV